MPSRCLILAVGGRCRKPGREIGDARHVGEGDDAAVVVADAELALSLEGRACHRLGYVAGAER